MFWGVHFFYYYSATSVRFHSTINWESPSYDEGQVPIPFRMISYAAGTTGKHECGDPLGQVKDGMETG